MWKGASSVALFKKLARLTKDVVLLPVDVALDAIVPRVWRADEGMEGVFRTADRARRLGKDAKDIGDWWDDE